MEKQKEPLLQRITVPVKETWRESIARFFLKQNKWRTNVGQIGAGLTGRTLQDSSQTM